jgi:peroxiredoxin
MRNRVLVLPLAALIIAALVVYRLQRERRALPAAPIAARQLAPRFELYDQQNQLVKFERYLGRTKLVVVFFDGPRGADADPWLTLLRDHHDAVSGAGVQVIAISTATPFAIHQAEERAERPFPFPVLTDIDPRLPVPAPVHRLWGLYDEGTQTTRTGVFLVDRAGMVTTGAGGPVPVPDADAAIAALCDGESPAT